MEYFKYDYKETKNELNFSNYESFIYSKTYKFYLFDLALLRFDRKIEKLDKSKANQIIINQKILFYFPYFLVGATLIYQYKNKLFKLNMLEKEFKIIYKLFAMILSIRLFQKALLKYEGDQILLDISKNKKYSN